MNQSLRTFCSFCLLITLVTLLLCGCQSQPPATRQNPVTDFLAQKAKESGGDFSKLSPEDQKKVQRMTQGHGEQAIRGRAGSK